LFNPKKSSSTAENPARPSRNQIAGRRDFNAEAAEVFAKAAKRIRSAFLCAILRGLCVKKSSQDAMILEDSTAENTEKNNHLGLPAALRLAQAGR